MTASPEERIEELEAELDEALTKIVDLEDTIDSLKRANQTLDEKVQNATDTATEMLRDLAR
ncbi:hypothetical protein ACFXA3_00510 [Streptomyces sp. NPDC059456]|uniref:hypothetical protein n=1 Tax=Streptomyces sp. NPDC059456 TaxID=3346838 RepID=UPI003676C9A9